MGKLFKRITATAAAALSLGIVCVVGFADTYPKRVTNSYASFEWGPGYANTTNMTPNLRLTYAYVDVYKEITGDFVTSDYKNGVIGFNKTASASVNYSTNGYSFVCGGGIYGDGTSHSPVMWSGSYPVE